MLKGGFKKFFYNGRHFSCFSTICVGARFRGPKNNKNKIPINPFYCVFVFSHEIVR